MANWTEIKLDLAIAEVNGAKWIAAPWLVALKAIEDCNHLRIEADGEWQLLPGIDATCGADGSAAIPFAEDALILPTCRPGALIGKIGGSSAAIEPPPADPSTAAGQPAIFAIGSTCIVALKDLAQGPLFIGVNVKARPLEIKRLELKVFGATLG